MGRGDLTNEQWARLESLLPKGKKPGRPPKWSKRQLIDGIRWRVRVGSPWRDVRNAMGLALLATAAVPAARPALPVAAVVAVAALAVRFLATAVLVLQIGRGI